MTTAAAGAGAAVRRPPMVLVFAITVTGILGNTLIAAPVPDILAAFGRPDTEAGFVIAAATLPGIVVAPVIGLLADRYGRGHVLIPCLLVFGAAGLAGAAAPTFAMLLACRFLQGFGSAGLINLAVVVIADAWDGYERARRIGQNAAVLTVSVAITPAVGGALAQLGSWRYAFLPYAIALVTAAAVFRWLPPRPRPAEVPTFRSQLRSASTVVRQPAVWGSITFGFVLFILVFGLFLTVMPVLLAQRFDLDAGARGLILSAPATTSTIAALSLGRLRSRRTAGSLLVAANVLFCAGFGLIGLATALPVVILGAFVYGFGEGSSIPTVQDVVASRAPEASRAAVVALWVGAARAGQTVGPLASGALLAVLDPSSVFLVGAAVAAALLVGQLVGRRLVG